MSGSHLTLKVPITTAADDIHKHFFHCFSEKIRLDVSSESSAWLLCQAEDSHEKLSLTSSKDKSKKLKCRLLQFLFGALRINRKNKILTENSFTTEASTRIQNIFSHSYIRNLRHPVKKI